MHLVMTPFRKLKPGGALFIKLTKKRDSRVHAAQTRWVKLRKLPMHPKIVRPKHEWEFPTPERCKILEAWNEEDDAAVSIARARVVAGVTTQSHRLRRVDERYLIVQGTGLVKIGDGRAES